VLTALATLIAVAVGNGIAQQGSAAADLQNGDFLVGVSVDQGFGGTQGRIVRVRAGQATTFCETVTGNREVPGFWNTPSDVLIDAQGRVVFLAYLGGAADPVPNWGFGLWRCDSMGATPTLLGAFGSDQSDPPLNYPSPLGDRDVQFAGGLHLKHSKGLDLNTLTMTESQFYVFAVADVYGDRALADTIAYNPATGDWIETFEDPVPTDQPGTSTNQIDMINANGYTFSVAGGSMRGFAEPISLDFQIGEFTGGLAFQSLHDLSGAAVDDSLTPNRPSGCPPHLDNVPLSVPTAADGNIYPMNELFQLAWGEGLILENNYGGGGYLFLPNVSLALFDLIPANDEGAMFHERLGCSHQKKLDFTAWHSTLSDSDGTPRGVTRMTPDGTAGTQNFLGRIAGVGPSQEVAILAEGLNNPNGIDVYPGFTPTTTGIAMFFQINSPVSVLITGPDGRRIGVDPDTSQFVNDYGDAGYDSNTNEPHIYGIRDPLPGDYSIATKGTGTGPYTIATYGANLGTQVITQTSFTGNASPGGSSSHMAGVDGEGVVTNNDPIADADGDGYSPPGDCNDGDASVNPGAGEIPYNGKDDDCNPATPDDDLDADTYPAATDCNDGDASVNPGAVEIPYNGKDDDCNPATPDDDLDADTYPVATDCNDGDASVNPGAVEVPYNGKDDDCNPATPDDDVDADTYPVATDCNDGDSTVYPGAPELADGKDNDCDGEVDEGLGPSDSDGDGIPDATDSCPNAAEDFDGFQDGDGCPEPCRGGDVDGDGMVDIRDVRLVVRAFGSRPGQPRWDSAADLNHNGRVDLGDLLFVLRSSLDGTCRP
jgi:hypothetical protein